MRLWLRGPEVAETCCTSSAMNRAFGSPRAAKLRQRLSEIAGAPSLGALGALPAIDLQDEGPDGRMVLNIDASLSIVLEVTIPVRRSGPAIAGHEVTIIEVRRIDKL